MKARRTAILAALLTPAYLWLALGILAPLLVMLGFSLLTEPPIGGRTPTWTLEHYALVFDPLYGTLLLRSLRLAAETTFWCLLLGYPLAYALARAVPGRWKLALLALVVVPFWSNSLVRIYAWIVLLRRNGLIDQVGQQVGLEWASQILYAYPAIVLGLVHAFLPYMVLTLYVAIDRIEPQLLEAAAGLGASAWMAFRRVILPLSLPGAVAGVILVFIPALGAFVEPRLLGGRMGSTLGTAIEDQFVRVFNWPLGAALSFALLAVVLLVMALLSWLHGVLVRRTQARAGL